MRELKRIRNERGWSQQKLADESGVNKATINQVEQGKRSPTIETLEKLAGALGVEVADFFPKAQSPLPLLDFTEQQYGAPELEGLVGGQLAHQWRERLEAWNANLPEDGRELTRNQRVMALILLEWATEITRTKITYEVISGGAGYQSHSRFREALQEMEAVSSAALRKAARTLKRAETDAEFQRIVEENELLKTVQLDA